VWLGTTYASVVTWTNQQIVADVAAISQSGTAQVQQNGALSNTVTFNVNTATVTTVSPNNGVPGTQVTIHGSGFGATQGSGQVWIGTANGVVQTWSDGLIVAEVATGSMSGNVVVLQNGVMSNPVAFTLNSLQVTTVTPNSGGPGTSVTIKGSGFGATQGSGVVWLGSTAGNVMSWSNTQVVAPVASSALSGVARIQQNDVWSNAVTFTVPASGGSLTLSPNMLNMVVGETSSIEAVNASGQSVAGLTWVSSSPKIVSLSTDDPPTLAALALGHVTITAGTASADVYVYPSGPLPQGTALWSNPGDGSGVTNIVPAVPSASGVADIFAFNADNTVSAVRSDGTTAWMANLNGAQSYETTPDFQGGLIVPSRVQPSGPITSIAKLDGITGQAYPAFTVNPATDALSGSPLAPLAHTEGTVFAYDSNNYMPICCTPSGAYYYQGTVSLIGINPTTGGEVLSSQLTEGKTSYSTIYDVTEICIPTCPLAMQGEDGSSSNWSAPTPPSVWTAIIAGDGFQYTLYTYQVVTSVNSTTGTYGYNNGPFDDITTTNTTDTTTHLMLKRVGTDGTASDIDVQDFDQKTVQSSYGGSQPTTVTTGTELNNVQVITNADQGVALGWSAATVCPPPSRGQNVCAPVTNYGFATTVGASASSFNVPTAAYPVLQAQDGTFYGTDNNGNMIRSTQSGATLWSVPNDSPQIATADGGVIGYTGITYDNQGRATGQSNVLTTSWTEQAYAINSSGSLQSFGTDSPLLAQGFWDLANANKSANLAAVFQGACPDSVTLANTTQIPLLLGFPSLKTGIGIVVALQVNPPKNPVGKYWDWTPITESFTKPSSSCPTIVPACVPGPAFVVSEGGKEYGITFPATSNVFYDRHFLRISESVLSSPGAPSSCTVTCHQTYSCGKKKIGAFTIKKNLEVGTIQETPVTNVDVTDTPTPQQ
jgi:hypothetical protein